MGLVKSDLVYILETVKAAEQRASAQPPALARAKALIDVADLDIGTASTSEGRSAAPHKDAWMALYADLFDFHFSAFDAPVAGARFIPLSVGDDDFTAGGANDYLVLETSTEAHGAYSTETRPDLAAYATHPSVLALLRNYETREDKTAATGALIAAPEGGAPSFDQISAHLAEHFGMLLSEEHWVNAPLLATDAFGAFLPGPNGGAQLVGPGGLIELSSAAPSPVTLALKSGQSLAEAIARLPFDAHNGAVTEIKTALLESGDLDLLNQWLNEPRESAPCSETMAETLSWNGDLLFQTARFVSEMSLRSAAFVETGEDHSDASQVFAIAPPAETGENGALDDPFDLSFLAELARQAASDEGRDLSDLLAAHPDTGELDVESVFLLHEEAGRPSLDAAEALQFEALEADNTDDVAADDSPPPPTYDF